MNKHVLVEVPMRRLAQLFSWIAIVLMMFIVVACNRGENQAHSQPVEISVLAAASLTDAMKEIKSRYESTHPGVQIVTSFASSGKLKQQIEQGAPADLFISAGAKEMDALVREGIVDPRDRTHLLSNELVLVVPKESHVKARGFPIYHPPNQNDRDRATGNGTGRSICETNTGKHEPVETGAIQVGVHR